MAVPIVRRAITLRAGVAAARTAGVADILAAEVVVDTSAVAVEVDIPVVAEVDIPAAVVAVTVEATDKAPRADNKVSREM